MKFKLTLFIVTLFIPASLQAITLTTLFQNTLKTAESYQTQELQIDIAEAKYAQAWSAILPQVSLSALYYRQQTPSSALASSIFPEEQSTTKLQISQALFRGFRDYLALDQLKAQKAVLEYAKAQSKLQLYQALAQSFYNCLMLESDIRNLGKEIEMDRTRMTELEKLRRVGRSRETEILDIQSAILSLEVQVSATKAQLEVELEALRFLSGTELKTLEESVTLPTSTNTLDFYLNSVEKRPEVLAAQKDLESAEKALASVRNSALPSLDLSGNYYFNRPNGVLRDVKWDAQISATMPLWTSGNLDAQIKIANLEYKSKLLALSRIRRLVTQEITSGYAVFKWGQDQNAKLMEATHLSNRNFELKKKDYLQGLITNLEVLQTGTIAQQINRARDRTYLKAKLDYLKLTAASGIPYEGDFNGTH